MYLFSVEAEIMQRSRIFENCAKVKLLLNVAVLQRLNARRNSKPP